MWRHFSWLIYLPICDSSNIEMTFRMFGYIIHQFKGALSFSLTARHSVFASILFLPYHTCFTYLFQDDVRLL